MRRVGPVYAQAGQRVLKKNALGRLQEEGPSAGSGGGVRDYGVNTGCPKHLIEIHRAFHNEMRYDEKAAFWQRFVKGGSKQEKAARLGISVPTYFRRLGAAMSTIA